MNLKENNNPIGTGLTSLTLRPKPVKITKGGDGITLAFNGRFIHVREVQRSGRWSVKTKENGNMWVTTHKDKSSALAKCKEIFTADLEQWFEVVE